MYQVYETERLILKTLVKDAAPMVLSFYDDNRSFFEAWEPKRAVNFYTLNYQKTSLTAEANQAAEGKLLRYWVFLKENPNEIIGTVCFQNFQKEPYLSCCLGYKFARKYTHNGYASESIQKGIEIMIKDYNIHRIEAFVMPNNYSSIRLIERLSFIYEGISYSYAKVNGVWSDHRRYAYINYGTLIGNPATQP
jgi:ribosomal-protein-alanine N-acetyltransferase